MTKNKSKKKRVLKHLTNIGMAALSFTLMTSSATAIDPVKAAGQVGATEGGRITAKEVLNAALNKPSIFVACGILISKTFG